MNEQKKVPAARYGRTATKYVAVLLGTAMFALLAAENVGELWACAPAPSAGQRVRIAEESAIIVWDKARGVEHFIRTASFDTTAKNFGFLVPTPTTPKLAEADEQAFQLLTQETFPKRIEQEQHGFKFSWWLAGRDKGDTVAMPATGGAMDVLVAADAPPPVRVLAEQTVAGYDAVVLEADNAPALRRWLASHNYDARPELIEWLAPYVAARWKITAFKIAARKAGEGVATSPVRMSFQTPTPFFPYREPADQRENKTDSQSRLLRVFFVGSERVAGKIGKSDTANLPQWPGKTKWTDAIDDSTRAELTLNAALTPNDMPTSPLKMTVFEDEATPRPGVDDVFFSPSPDQSAITPPPIIRYVDRRGDLPKEGVVLAGLVGAGLVVRAVRRRKRKI